MLVASPAALASANVRNEWQRALAAGKRIVLLGWFRRVRLPSELQGCEWIDFRGRFNPALQRLVATLSADAPATHASVAPAGPYPGRGPWLPPAVLGMLIALAAPIVGYALAVAPEVARNDFEDLGLGLGRVGDVVLFAAFTLALVWGLCLSLVQRRMGMTRLMVCLGFVAAPFLLTTWKLARHGAAGLQDMPPLVAQAMLQHQPLAWALAALPLAAMAVAVVVAAWRPAALDAHRQGLVTLPHRRGAAGTLAGQRRCAHPCRHRAFPPRARHSRPAHGRALARRTAAPGLGPGAGRRHTRHHRGAAQQPQQPGVGGARGAAARG